MAVTLPALFSQGMVLQRDIALPVWGWAQPGEVVTVALNGASAQARANDDGCWRVVLPAMPAGGPHQLLVNDLSVRDVLIGEVWLCSGQSNMEMHLQDVADAEHEIAGAVDPGIRHFDVRDTAAFVPKHDVQGDWQRCTPQTAPTWTAVGYFFARELRKKFPDIPVGLINASWGGSAAEAWISRDALRQEQELRGILDYYEETLGCLEVENLDTAAVLQRYHALIPSDDENRGMAQGWADPAYDDAGWDEMAVPQSWQQAGLRFSGVLWFRKTVDLPAAWAGHDLMLHPGACDKSDIAYVNGVQVGAMRVEENPESWCTPRAYRVQAAVVKPGKNVIAIRVFSHQFAGGLLGPAEEMYLEPVGLPGATRIPLHGRWQYAVERNFGKTPMEPSQPIGAGYPSIPGILFNGMIAPLVTYAIRGAIWYQGESNADRARAYRVLFPAMIRDWRARWGQGDFPFYFVQLANFMAPKTLPSESEWAELREAQAMTLRLPQTGMAVIIDIGDPVDIHPKNKQEVGRRLALNALAQAYGQELVFAGPCYRSMTVEGGAVRLTFDHAAGGLVAKDGQLAGFAVAGADRQFAWAEARIEGETVVVASPQVAAPVAVRYAWADNPPCSLYNAAGLPASPFRTDDWPVEIDQMVGESAGETIA